MIAYTRYTSKIENIIKAVTAENEFRGGVNFFSEYTI